MSDYIPVSWPANAGHPGDAGEIEKKEPRIQEIVQNPTGWPAFAGHDSPGNRTFYT